jgi:hypothetical protein
MHALQVCGLIIENSFTSIPDLVDVLFPLLRYFKPLILKIGWRTVDIIPRLAHDMLFIRCVRSSVTHSRVRPALVLLGLAT